MLLCHVESLLARKAPFELLLELSRCMGNQRIISSIPDGDSVGWV